MVFLKKAFWENYSERKHTSIATTNFSSTTRISGPYVDLRVSSEDKLPGGLWVHHIPPPRKPRQQYKDDWLPKLVFPRHPPLFRKGFPTTHLVSRSMFWPKLDQCSFVSQRPKLPQGKSLLLRTPKLLDSSPHVLECLWQQEKPPQGSLGLFKGFIKHNY